MSITEKQNQDIIGRDQINNIEAILSIPITPTNEIEHAVKNNADTIFTWDYSLTRPPLRKLYEKAKTSQWNGTTDLPWDTVVDIEKTVAADQAASRRDTAVTGKEPVEKNLAIVVGDRRHAQHSFEEQKVGFARRAQLDDDRPRRERDRLPLREQTIGELRREGAQDGIPIEE